jgi:hypothetical protein
MGWVELAFVALVFGVMFLGRRGSAPKGPPPAGGEAEGDGAARPEVLTLGSMLAAWQEAVNAARLQTEAAQRPHAPDALDSMEAPTLVLPPVASAPRGEPVLLPAVVAKPAALVKRAPVEVATVDRDAEHARFHERITPAPAGAPSARRIRGAGELRRAVLLSEVLGPPRALRELDTP